MVMVLTQAITLDAIDKIDMVLTQAIILEMKDTVLTLTITFNACVLLELHMYIDFIGRMKENSTD